MASSILILVTVFVIVLADQDDFPLIWNCDDIKCVDMINIGPPCFSGCPNGHTCRVYETGDIIKAGQKYKIGGMTCECRHRRMPNWDMARCQKTTFTNTNY